MVENASSLQSCLEKENEIEGGVLFKIKEDPRITRVGKFLRRYSIDELPQLVNVLKGDMSIVGPRPLTIRDFSRLSSNQYHRHDVLPGITGLWQVKGRSGSKSKKLHVYDFFYVNRWSLKLDLMILFQTILVVVAGKGA
jgi:lipopolysaccharide/colanic/teichoic acid biosynthesis glycosyltransferase